MWFASERFNFINSCVLCAWKVLWIISASFDLRFKAFFKICGWVFLVPCSSAKVWVCFLFLFTNSSQFYVLFVNKAERKVNSIFLFFTLFTFIILISSWFQWSSWACIRLPQAMLSFDLFAIDLPFVCILFIASFFLFIFFNSFYLFIKYLASFFWFCCRCFASTV